MSDHTTHGTDFAVEAPSPALEALWQAFDKQGEHGFFQTWHWAGTLLRALPAHAAPQILVARQGKKPAGLALLTLRRARYAGAIPVRQASLNATGDKALDCVMIEHNGFASPGPPMNKLWSDLIEAFEHGFSGAGELVLPGVESGVVLPQTSHLLQSTRRTPAYRTDLESVRAKGGIADVLSVNARRQLNRSLRECRSHGALRLEVARNADTAQAYFSGLKELHIASWVRRGRRNAFDAPFFETFHRRLIAESVQHGVVDLLRISAGYVVLGYLYNFRRNGVVYSYQSGFDSALSQLRPGYVCHALAIEHYAREGNRIYDFLAGFNQLKRSFATEEYAMSWHRLRRPLFLFRAEALARSVVRRVKAKTDRT